MLVSSVRAAHRPRGIPSGSLGAAGRLQSAALLSHQLQQTRGFRFGWYRASYGSPEQRPDDMYRRCRKFRYKYTSSTVRDTTPARTVLADDADSTARRFGLWRIHGRAREHSHKAQGAGGPTMTPGNPEGVRPGQNIEDVERAPMESLIFGTTHPRGSTGGTPGPDSEGAFTIDPITNRKVWGSRSGRMGASSASKVAGFARSNKPDLESLRPPHVDDAPSGDPFDAPPILESEQYLADLAGFPAAQDIFGVKEKDVSWHSAEGLAAPPQTNGDEHPFDHQVLSHGSRKYDDLHKYGPVDLSEPNGKMAPETWDRSPTRQYEDTSRYGAVRSHEPDGKYKGTSESPVDSSELREYKPVRSHEPDGKYKETSESPVDPSELREYKPVRSHEPDGKYKEDSEPTLDTSELKKYQPFRSHEPDGKYKETPESTVDANDLGSYKPFRSHEPDGKYKETSESTADTSELKKYQPFRSHEPDGKYKQKSKSSVDPSELAKYQPFRAHEPDGMYAAANNTAEPDVKKDYPDLDWYNHGLFSHEPDGKYAAADNESGVETSDLSSYGAFRSHEPDGKYVADAAKPTPAQVLEGESFEYDVKGFDATDATPQEKTYYRQMLESLMAQEKANAVATKQKVDHTAGPAEKKILTGNYVRDFPEEFARSWTTKDSTLVPTDIDQSISTTTPLPTQPQATPTPDLQPALDRISKSTPNLQPALDRVSTSKPLTPAHPTQTLYKLLTHDPLTTLITTTTTTSSTPPSTAPLSPAEILPRISHPARFTPHFAALQAQGFELVSGAGDVLVFRQVREPVSEAGSVLGEAKGLGMGEAEGGSPVNPIDMMGKPAAQVRREYYATAAERFASPTGFVNYELPRGQEREWEREQEQEQHRERGEGQQQQVRRVEEVFSGGREGEGEVVSGEPREKSVGKRLVLGGVWVAGLAYLGDVLMGKGV